MKGKKKKKDSRYHLQTPRSLESLVDVAGRRVSTSTWTNSPPLVPRRRPGRLVLLMLLMLLRPPSPSHQRRLPPTEKRGTGEE